MRKLAGVFGDAAHSRRVTRLALSLFDQLAEPLGLGEPDRTLLETAALLHDIGWRCGQEGHHKESMRMILAEADLGLSAENQLVVANTARYHRRALPSLRHAKFRQLTEPDRRRVKTLGGLLRLADGLDCRHLGRVRQVKVTLTDRRLVVHCRAVGEAREEDAAARNKRDLLEDAIRRNVALDWNWISG
ncbi:MAG: HD domain-containing protein [Planctomycetota bacterium]|nr:HD domain-containing protein [Planctomycetota bacterium]